MAIQGEYTIDAPRAAVWQALNDPAVLQVCIPGCESMTKSSDTEIEAKINAQIGPIRSSFATHIVLSDIDPPSGYTLNAEGKALPVSVAVRPRFRSPIWTAEPCLPTMRK